jgi:hypothetical protein
MVTRASALTALAAVLLPIGAAFHENVQQAVLEDAAEAPHLFEMHDGGNGDEDITGAAVDSFTLQPSGPVNFLDSAVKFKNVCPTFNIDNQEQVERGILWFDQEYDHPKRCVPCNNPVMAFEWDAVHGGQNGEQIKSDYVFDRSAIDSGRWEKEGGLLHDGGHGCGMMWTHKHVAKSVGDYNQCTAKHAQEIKDRSQRQSPGHVKTVKYHGGTGLLLAWYHNNPGHQLLDVLQSYIPVLVKGMQGDPQYTKLLMQQSETCPDKQWICQVLKVLGTYGSETHKVKVMHQPADVLHCFEELIVPKLGYYGRNPQGMPKETLDYFMDHLWKSFGLGVRSDGPAEASTKRQHILVYSQYVMFA